jgi:outer membrane lipoprotein carrier protein
MAKMKRLALCMLLLWFANPSMAGGVGGDPGKSQDPVPEKTEETRQPEQEAPLLDSILSQMDASYRKLRSYRAEFEQESEIKTFKRKRKASGRVYFLKPDEMRWNYLEPEEREVYLSGETIHIYLPGRNQVIEQTLNDAMPGVAPARLFMGVEELAGSFSISADCADEDVENAYCLRLTPKTNKAISVEEILLWVGKKDFLPLRTESRDVLGNRTTISFRNGEVNVPLKKELFQFHVPPDAEVISNSF